VDSEAKNHKLVTGHAIQMDSALLDSTFLNCLHLVIGSWDFFSVMHGDNERVIILFNIPNRLSRTWAQEVSVALHLI
jgi:hypothetical protein